MYQVWEQVLLIFGMLSFQFVGGEIHEQFKVTCLGVLGFPGGSDDKDSACNAGDLGSILALGISPTGGHDNLLQYSCLENPHGQRSLASYCPWGHKDSDTTD